MGTATLEVSGAQAARWAAELRAALAATVQQGATVKILFGDGTQDDLSTVDQGRLEVVFRQVESQRR